MSVVYRQQVGSNTADLPKPSALADGDLLLAFVHRNSTTPASAASGWSTLLTRAAPSGSSVLVAYKQVTNAAGEPATYTFTNANNIVGVAIYGHDKGDPFFFSESQSTTATGLTFASSGFTLDSDDYYAFASIGSSSTTGFNISSAPTNWTHLQARQRMKAARYAIVSGTYSSILYPFGTSSVALVGAIVVVRPAIIPPTMTASATANDPAVAVGVVVPAEASQASLASDSPSVSAGATQALPTMAAQASALTPTASVSAMVVVPTALATAEGLLPTAVAGALQSAPLLNATAAAGNPAVAGSALVSAGAQGATGLLATPVVAGGAVVASASSVATAAAGVPDLLQYVPVPTAAASVVAAAPDVVTGALTAAAAASASAIMATPGLGMAQFAPAMAASAAGVAPSLTWGARLASSSATVTAEALVAEAGMVRHPVAFRGGAAHVMVKARHANNERQETAKAEHRQLVSHETFAVRRGGVAGSATVTAPVAASVNREV